MQTMMPKVQSTSHPGMELIRPLYYVKEDDVIAWKDRNNLDFIQCACRFTEEYTENHNEDGKSKRQEMKTLIKEMKKVYANIDINIFNSVQNVNLDTIISYKRGENTYHFLDDYEERLEKKIEKKEAEIAQKKIEIINQAENQMIINMIKNNIDEKTESVNSREEAYCDGEPDKVNPCFIIRERYVGGPVLGHCPYLDKHPTYD